MSKDDDLEMLRGMVRMLSDRVGDLEATRTRTDVMTRRDLSILEDRINALEARLAMMTAAMTMPASTQPDDDQPTIIHDVAPNAPR